MLTPRHAGYAPAPVGWKADPPSNAAGSGLRRRFGTWQERTFFLSLAAQLGVLVLSFVAFGQWETTHPILRVVLILETVVQGVEFCWYSTIGSLYLWGRYHIGTGARYYDWAITTPVMLITLMFFALWESDRCLTTLNIVENERGTYLGIIIVFDWIMLLYGYAYANKNVTLMGVFDYVPVRLLGFRDNAGIYLGWVPFLISFTPLFIMMGTEKFKLGGILSISVSFVAWALYGVVAVMAFFHSTLSEEDANTAYNVLDIVSKNVLGVVVSTVVLSSNGTTAEDCYSPPSLPPAPPPPSPP